MKGQEFQILAKGRNTEFYKLLMAIWMGTATEIEMSRDSAAKRGTETAWRYYAGQEKGFKRCMMLLDEKLAQMEQEGGDPSDEPSEQIKQLLEEARGATK